MYDYGARNYDPALGRWMNVDPLAEKYFNISPYVYCDDSPSNAIDPDGRRIIFVIYDKEGKEHEKLVYRNGNFYHNNGKGARYNPKENLSPVLNLVLKAYREIIKSGDKELIKMLTTLENSKQTHRVEAGDGPNQNYVTSQIYPENDLRNYYASEDVKNNKPVDTMTRYNFSKESQEDFKEVEGVPNTYFTTTVHEMSHQYDFDQGKNADSRGKRGSSSPTEQRAVKTENRARKIKNLPKRTTYGGQKIN